MRLDFETFTTTGPTVTNDNSPPAGLDSFIVTSSPNGYVAPTISGENKGQHSKGPSINHVATFPEIFYPPLAASFTL